MTFARYKKPPFWEPDPRLKGVYNRNARNFNWRNLLFWKREAWKDVKSFLEERHKLGYTIFPSTNYEMIFRSLLVTSFLRTKIVIIGQDPYYVKGVADGLAFSCRPTTKPIPRSLQAIFLEYRQDLGFKYPINGSLLPWANRGILLLNTYLTVEEGKPKSHRGTKYRTLWVPLVQEIIQQLSQRKDKLVFILWGSVAQEHRYLIDENKHLVLVGAHPSPRNQTWTGGLGRKKFPGGRYFSKACEYLSEPHSIWRLP